MSRATELFEIQTRLAVGDAALVYRALDQSGRLVALKLLLPEEQIAHPLDVESLLRDASQLQTITGVNIVQLLDAFPDEDGTILVYEYACPSNAQVICLAVVYLVLARVVVNDCDPPVDWMTEIFPIFIHLRLFWIFLTH